jgi:hypothetical protein
MSPKRIETAEDLEEIAATQTDLINGLSDLVKELAKCGARAGSRHSAGRRAVVRERNVPGTCRMG